MRDTSNLLDIQKYMPIQSQAALNYFVELNANYKGAHWADILDNLNESDCHLEIVEPIYEAVKPFLMIEELPMVSLVTYTLLYANNGAPPYSDMVAYWVGYLRGRRYNAKGNN
jgi:hypothetical protein